MNTDELKDALGTWAKEQTQLSGARGATPVPGELQPDSKATPGQRDDAMKAYTRQLLAKPSSQLTSDEVTDLRKALAEYGATLRR
jgi:hypothetical protein